MDLYVAGFPLDLDEQKLTRLFDLHGFTVSKAKIIKDKSTGFSKGFGFITVETKEEAAKLISKLNGQFLEGWKMTVKEANPKEQKPEAYTPRKWREKASCEGEL